MSFSLDPGSLLRNAAYVAMTLVLSVCPPSFDADPPESTKESPAEVGGGIPEASRQDETSRVQRTPSSASRPPAPTDEVATRPAPQGHAVPGDETAVPPTAFAGEAIEGYPFGPQSVWRLPLGSAPVAATSDAMVAHLAGTVHDRYGGVAAFNVYQYNNSYYVAAPGTPRQDVAFDDCQGKNHVPEGLYGPGGQFTQVPIPAGAVPSPGTDRALSVYSPETDQLWEFWVTNQRGDGTWSACWGGRIDDVSSSLGFFDGHFGATATGLSSTGGMVRLDEVRAGRIEHAMSLAIPNPRVWSVLSWPAQRSDGFDDHPDAVPEGTRLRLDPSIDVGALGLHPIAEMVARAAQQYGFIVVDKAGSVSVIAESGAPEEAVTGRDPWVPLMNGTPDHQIMANFPWDALQALPMDYGRP